MVATNVRSYIPTDVKIPDPPPLPKYDPNEEAPKWNWGRLKYSYLPVEKTEPWPRVGDTPKDGSKPDWRGVVRDNVVEWPLPEKYKFGQPELNHYFFFDTPDYADPFKKLWFSFKFFLKSGLVFASLKGVLHGLPFTLDVNINLFRTIVGPWMLGGLTTSAAVITIANLRGKKDDYKNYLAAGLVTGAIMGRHHYKPWMHHTLFWTGTAFYMKYVAETNGIILAPYSRRLKTVSLSANPGDRGFWSGDFRPFMSSYGDPGRDTRNHTI